MFPSWSAVDVEQPEALRKVRRFVLLFAVVSAGALVAHVLAASGRPLAVRLGAVAVALALCALWVLRARRPVWWGEAVLGAAALGLAAVALPEPEQALGLVFVAAIRHCFGSSTRTMVVAVSLLMAGYLCGVYVAALDFPNVGAGTPAAELPMAIVPLAWVVVAAFAVRLTVDAVWSEWAANARASWSGSRLSAVLEVSPIGMVLLDRTNRVALWNGAAERIFGWSAEQVLGLEASTRTAVESAERSGTACAPLASPLFRAVLERCPAEDALASGHRYVVHGQRRDQPVALAVSAAPVHEPDGTPGGVLLAVSDLVDLSEAARP